MDHADVLELIDLAAVEPDGLARLAAGDTSESAVAAGHLAACEACSAELAATARSATLARAAIRELPDPALRERTLAFVREVGRDRSVQGAAAATAATAPVHEELVAAAGADAPTAGPEAEVVVPLRRPSRRPWWYAASIAAVLIAAVGGFAVGGSARQPIGGDDGHAAITAAQTTMHIAEQRDAVSVHMAPTARTAGTAAASTAAASTAGNGTVMYSVLSGELAVTVAGLPPAPDGAVYTCWEEHNGQRHQIGTLYVDRGDGTWAGSLAGLDQLGPGTVFGVSVVAAGAADGTAVMKSGG
jgi:hypothetical protein